MNKILLALSVVMLPSIGWAQDAPVSGGWDIAFVLYALGGTLLTGGASWALKRLADYLGVKINNETVAGISRRLLGAIGSAVAMVDQTVRKEIEAARDPASPGGVKITTGERKLMLDAAWGALKDEYGSLDALFAQLAKIGVADPKAKVDTLIEAAVGAHKILKRNPK